MNDDFKSFLKALPAESCQRIQKGNGSMVDPISMAVVGKVIVFVTGTIVLVVTASKLVSQLSTPKGLACFQQLPAETRIEIMEVLSRTAKGRALLPSLLAGASQPGANVGPFIEMMQSLGSMSV